MAVVNEEKDLGIFVTNNFKPSLNCDKASKSANKVIGLIRRNIINKNEEGMLILYKTLIRPILDYCIPAWRPYFKRDIGKLEKLQKRFTKMIAGCKNLKYEQRLMKLGLTSLQTRHYRADMIQTFKVLNDCNNKIYPVGFLSLAERAGRKNSKKLYKKRNFLEVSRNGFTSRVVDKWNELPETVVSAEDVNVFKGRLDNHMRDVRGRLEANA